MACIDSFVLLALGLGPSGWALPQVWGLQRFHTGSGRSLCFLQTERGGSRVRPPRGEGPGTVRLGDQAWRAGAGSPFRGKVAQTEEQEVGKSRG